MKVCKMCKIEYSDDVSICSKCGIKLEKESEEWTTPQTYEIGY